MSTTTQKHTVAAEPAALPGPAAAARRIRIVEVAMQYFAELGYEGTRIDDMARELGISKASVFQQFGSKRNLFMAAYQKATDSMQAYLDVPPELREEGFFATLRWWLEQTEQRARAEWIAWQVMLVGNYGTDMDLRMEISRYLTARDPWKTEAFVRWGVGRGEVRDDLDPLLISSSMDWMVERFQDVLMNEELHPLLFGRPMKPARRTQARIEQFMKMIHGAFAARKAC